MDARSDLQEPDGTAIGAMNATILQGDCLQRLAELPEDSVNCCITSPPYWGLRDYGAEGQIGLEGTVDEYVDQMVRVFDQVSRVLRDDGTLWLNLGDCYTASGWGGGVGSRSTIEGDQGKFDREARKVRRGPRLSGNRIGNRSSFRRDRQEFRSVPHKGTEGLRCKNLIGVPWRVAFALQAVGWILRADIIWHKPNPMPESVTDRPTKAHEYIFLFSKSERYHYDANAIAEPVSEAMLQQIDEGYQGHFGLKDYAEAGVQNPSTVKERIISNARKKLWARRDAVDQAVELDNAGLTRNKRTVWTVKTHPFKEAHFATFPPDLIRPCILAGCPAGGTVLDPFGGSGTTGMVALEYGRNAVLIELNPEYAEMARQRCNVTPGLPLETT